MKPARRSGSSRVLAVIGVSMTPGRNRIDPDSIGRKFASERLGEQLHRALRRRIAEVASATPTKEAIDATLMIEPRVRRRAGRQA